MSEYNKNQMQSFGRIMVEGFKKGDVDIVKGCLARGADPNVLVQNEDNGSWRPVLHWGSQSFNAACMQAMLDGGADIEARNGNGETALFYAVSQTKTEAVKFLMENGADPVALNGNGKTPMDVALGLRADHDYHRNIRDTIIKALAREYAPKEKPAPQQAFNDTAGGKAITAPKTASFGHKDKGNGQAAEPKKGFSL